MSPIPFPFKFFLVFAVIGVACSGLATIWASYHVVRALILYAGL